MLQNICFENQGLGGYRVRSSRAGGHAGCTGDRRAGCRDCGTTLCTARQRRLRTSNTLRPGTKRQVRGPFRSGAKPHTHTRKHFAHDFFQSILRRLRSRDCAGLKVSSRFPLHHQKEDRKLGFAEQAASFAFLSKLSSQLTKKLLTCRRQLLSEARLLDGPESQITREIARRLYHLQVESILKKITLI